MHINFFFDFYYLFIGVGGLLQDCLKSFSDTGSRFSTISLVYDKASSGEFKGPGSL